MQTALRPYVTAGVALVGASAIAVSPVTAPPAAVQIRDNAVQLSGRASPIEQFAPILQKALIDIEGLGQSIAADPAPILEQLLRNQATNIAKLPAGIRDQILAATQLPGLLGQAIDNEVGSVQGAAAAGQELLQNFIGLFTNGTLQDQIGNTLQDLQNGDFATAFNNAAVLIPLLLIAGDGLQNLALLPPILQALQQPLADVASLFPIAAGPLNNTQALIGQIPNVAAVLVIGALSPVSSIATGAGDTLANVLNAAQNTDPEGVLTSIIAGAVETADSLVTNTLDPTFGVAASLISIRQLIAAAITTPAATTQVADVPAATARTFTLTAPLVKAPVKELTSADTADAPAALTTGSQATDSAKDATPKSDSAKQTSGNLFTPGSSTKGGRHRAENGPSFGKELRDAVKGLTGLGRTSRSDKETSGGSPTSESGSSSAGSGESGSSGDNSK